MITRITIVLIIFTTIVQSAIAQNFNSANVNVRTAEYMDKTPPLRDMKIILPGERDRSWKDEIVQNEDRDESAQFAGFQPPSEDLVQQKTMGTRSVRGPLKNFAGVGRITPLTPPDTDGDVGPDHYFQMVNVSFAIWDKEGTLLYGPVDNSTLWSGFIGPWTGTNDGDPIVVYDEIEDRWIATQFAVNTSNGTYWELIAVSETGDPLGAYYRYAFQYSIFNDYPKFSSWPDGYYATYNMFSSGYAGSLIAAFEKDSMLVGAPGARVVEFGPFPNIYGSNTSDFDGSTMPPAGSPNWVVNLNKYGTPQTLEVYDFVVDWSNPSNSSFNLYNDLTVTAFDFFDPGVREQLPQPNTSQKLDPLSKYSMFPLKYRNFGTHESMTINHTVKLGERAGVRWYELRKDQGQPDWYIYQEGTYAPDDSLSRWMASLAMNANGDIALGYSVTGDSLYPSIRYTGRSANSPLGIMDIEEITIIGGAGYQSGSARWGDYSYMSVDPVDDTTFWFTQEYIESGWATRIASLSLYGDLLEPIVDAGDDTTACADYPFFAQGSAENYTGVEWETLGDGTLQAPNQLNTMYIRGPGDVDSGYFELVLTAIGYQPGMEDKDTLYVDLAYTVQLNAGSDTIICNDQSFMTQPTVEFADSLYWSTSGDGEFNDPNLENAIYTPGEQDILTGSVELELYARSQPPCLGEDDDKMVLTIDQCSFEDEMVENDIMLSIFPNPVTDVVNFEILTSKSHQVNISLLNQSGSVVFKTLIPAGKNDIRNSIDFKYFSSGIYYMLIESNGNRIVRKVIKK